MIETGFLVAALLSAATLWVVYLRWKDRHRPEPLGAILAAVAAGGLAVGAAFGAYHVFDWLGAEATWAALAGPWPSAIGIALVIGAVEEGAKLLPVVVFARWSRHFDEILDGAVYAGASAIGFSVTETVILLSTTEASSIHLLARSVAAPISHVLFAVPAGLGLAAFVLRKRWSFFAVGVAVSIVSHGAYDLLLARGVPSARMVAAGIVLVLWLAFLETARRLEPRRSTGTAGEG